MRACRIAAWLLCFTTVSVVFVGCPDDLIDPNPDAARWEVVFDDLDGALLSVWGGAPNDVWVVGSDPGDGIGPYVLHFDGQTWERMETGETGDLWWVSGTESSVWFAGAGGLVLRYDRADESFETMTTPTTAQLFGIFPAADGDVWAVGGELATQTGVVWRYQGNTWEAVADVPLDAAESGLFFKVWGRSATDLWIVGLGGVALHRQADGWTVVEDIAERLLTVHGGDDTVLAVGGLVDGFVIDFSAGDVVDVSPPDGPQFNGVWVTGAEAAIAVGREGSIWRYRAGDWSEEGGAPNTSWDYHAVFVDSGGGIWAVGGFVLAPPLHSGMLVHWGPPLPDTDF